MVTDGTVSVTDSITVTDGTVLMVTDGLDSGIIQGITEKHIHFL